ESLSQFLEQVREEKNSAFVSDSKPLKGKELLANIADGQ
ncbi:MAG: hypothetical protein ACJAWV_001336, partial [Flammeovirgaceae bacterium]